MGRSGVAPRRGSVCEKAPRCIVHIQFPCRLMVTHPLQTGSLSNYLPILSYSRPPPKTPI